MAFFFFLDSPFSCSILVHVVHVDSLLTIVVCCRPSAVGRSSLSVFPLSFLICGEREEEEENDDDDQRVEWGGGGGGGRNECLEASFVSFAGLIAAAPLFRPHLCAR